MSRVLDTLSELGSSSWAFSALCAAAEIGMLEALATPCDIATLSRRSGLSAPLARRIIDVLATVGIVNTANGLVTARPLEPLLRDPALTFLQAQLRLTALNAAKFLDEARRGRLGQSIWKTAGPELMQSQGIVSAIATEFLIRTTFPRVDGLLARLSMPGAVFLDAGAGVCGATIALARHFPRLHVIAIEPNQAAIRLARRNLRESRLGSRVSLKMSAVQAIRIRAAVDVAYIAAEFFDDESLDHGLRAVRAALRPGGFLLTTGSQAEGSGLAAAVSRLQSEILGGTTHSAERLVDRMNGAGYVDVRMLGIVSDTVPIVGRTSAAKMTSVGPGRKSIAASRSA